MKRKVPVFKTDEEAEAFLDQDLSDLDFSQFKPARLFFEFQPKTKSINLRLSESLLNTIRERAKREGVPYQRYIRQTLERALENEPDPRVRVSGKKPAPVNE